jgi:hypothetical protein
MHIWQLPQLSSLQDESSCVCTAGSHLLCLLCSCTLRALQAGSERSS